jgi:hypothetical protein
MRSVIAPQRKPPRSFPVTSLFRHGMRARLATPIRRQAAFAPTFAGPGLSGQRAASVLQFPPRRALTVGNEMRTLRHGQPGLPCPLFVRSGPHWLSRLCAQRLARIVAKYGPEITLRDLLDRFSYDCLWRTQSRTKRGRTDCGVYLPDFENRRPPDMPPGMVKLRLVKKAEG